MLSSFADPIVILETENGPRPYIYKQYYFNLQEYKNTLIELEGFENKNIISVTSICEYVYFLDQLGNIYYFNCYINGPEDCQKLFFTI